MSQLSVWQRHDTEDDGYTILIEGGDEYEVAAEIGYPLVDALFEGVYREDGCFVGCVLHNNQYGISWVTIDSPALEAASFILNHASSVRFRGF